MNTLLEQFATFTKEDWKAFDNIRALAFQPTQEEIEAEKQKQAELKKATIQAKLKALWVTRPQVITKEYVLWLLNMINAKQWIWEDIDTWFSNQITIFWDIETAFDELVYSRL